MSCWAALLDRPDVLILDNETTGLDCPEIVDIDAMIKQYLDVFQRCTIAAQLMQQRVALAVRIMRPQA